MKNEKWKINKFSSSLPLRSLGSSLLFHSLSLRWHIFTLFFPLVRHHQPFSMQLSVCISAAFMFISFFFFSFSHWLPFTPLTLSLWLDDMMKYFSFMCSTYFVQTQCWWWGWLAHCCCVWGVTTGALNLWMQTWWYVCCLMLSVVGYKK